MRLLGQTALVTGAASGIGAQVARRLAGEGAAVALVDLNQSGAEQVAQQICAGGGRAVAVGADVSSAAACAGAVRHTLDTYGSVEMLVHCAAILRDGLVLDSGRSTWDQVLEVNLRGTFHMSEEVSRVMIAQARGRIVLFGSRVILGDRTRVNYVTSKGGVAALTKSYALRLAAHRITVNCLCPGFTDTPINAMFPAEMFELARQVTPLRRVGTPDDLAGAVLFLVSNAAEFVTGQLIYVCGGRSLLSYDTGGLPASANL